MLFFSFLSAVLLHECGHLVGLILVRARIVSYRLSFFGITMVHTPLFSPLATLTVAGLGPIFSLFGFFVSHHSSFLHIFSLISLILALFNLLPIASLDGEKMLRSILALFLSPSKTERLSRLVSYLALFSLWTVGGYIFFALDQSPSLFLLSLTLFLQSVRTGGRQKPSKKS